ncbi:nitroreductase family protein [uncultured Muribaculum sp.]|jgi:Nitroreductase|uniref:nitroreductase family protein n=1 Tax=uncultured Muribaculum sp. TaxID=1918613 RepID=UPI00266FB0F2|nr:nitroreductase family protein [uncultured Muribaculum sp.]
MKRAIKFFLSLLGLKQKKYIDSCFDRDARLYAKNSGLQGETLPVIAAKMRILCHTIEKALSLSDCRADFGRDKINELIRLYQVYKSSEGKDKNAIELVEAIISVYAEHRVLHGLDISFIPKYLLNNSKTVIDCGAMPLQSTKDDFEAFSLIAHSRHSVRNYSSRTISEEIIAKAVELAQTAPSACNRQATKIYAITSTSKINAIKERHGGIRTFGQPGVIFVITQNLSLYINEYERNTWIVDGGIFCMNLLYALSSVGIVNCPVIWGGMDDEDKFICDLAHIPSNERPVVLVVGGYPPDDGVKTPCSSKRPVEDILHIVK